MTNNTPFFDSNRSSARESKHDLIWLRQTWKFFTMEQKHWHFRVKLATTNTCIWQLLPVKYFYKNRHWVWSLFLNKLKETWKLNLIVSKTSSLTLDFVIWKYFIKLKALKRLNMERLFDDDFHAHKKQIHSGQ